MDFASVYAHGLARVAACTVPVRVADAAANTAAVLAAARRCHDEGVVVAVFPEMSLSGYAIDDLVLQDALLDAVGEGLATLVSASADLMPLLIVGAPLRHRNRVLNCAVMIHRGQVVGVAPKAYLPTYREFYDRRYFGAGDDLRGEIDLPAHLGSAPLGTDLIVRASDLPGLAVHAEICEDMWVPVPPSSVAALAGATCLVNLSGSPITVARAEDRRLLVRSASARCLAAYLYSAAGAGESTTDLSWDGQTMIYECGDLLAETERFPDGAQHSIADIDLNRLHTERMRQGTFDDNRRTYDEWVADFRYVDITLNPPTGDIGLRRKVDRFPFVPDDPQRLAQDCYEAYNIQVSGLVQRLDAIGHPKIVIGVSGGLDSTHALIVAAKAMDRLGRPRSDILAFTMPGFATTDTTKSYATRLAQALGVTFEELDITPAARQMLSDLGHSFADGEPTYDVTFENVQAGLRTDYLFRIANQRGGIVLGTGDLSELALGWCTYGVGDQMSHYAVNTGVPKTLIQHLIRWVISSEQFPHDDVADVLQAVLDQEITPELIPAEDGTKPQATEDTVGPYALADFALFHLLRYGARPSKVAFLAHHAWADVTQGEWPPGYPEGDRPSYDLATIRHWLEVFLHRFFANQFKRSAVPNGPKVSAGGSLSPRGDWRMPSDASAQAWLTDLERVPTGGPRVLVIELEDCAPIGHLGTSLRAAGADLDVVRPFRGEDLPATLDGFAAMVILGGSNCANDDVDFFPAIFGLVRQAARDAVPSLGVCLGHQLSAVALGGTVTKKASDQMVGIYDMGWLPAARQDALFGSFPAPASAVHFNNDIVTALPEGAELLAATPDRVPQVVRFAPTVWGVQVHPEARSADFDQWAAMAGSEAAKQAAAAFKKRDAELAASWTGLAAGLLSQVGQHRP